MGRHKAKQLTDGILGQHLALSVAAGLARTQLVPDPLMAYDALHITETLNLVGGALARVAPLYVRDTKAGAVRELSQDELQGAEVRRGALLLVLKDGRTLSSVSIKRADLRQAIAVLKTVGIPELRLPLPKETPAASPEPPALAGQLTELEALLHAPLIAPQVEKANAIAVGIARQAREGRIANLAMQLVSAVHEAKSDPAPDGERLQLALAKLRGALEEQRTDLP